MSEITPEQIRWLWRDRIPLGAITVLDGDPGQAKSTITYDLTARLTRGLPMPGCKHSGEPTGVVLLQAEDSVASTMRPRLEAADADLDRVFVYDKRLFPGEPLGLPDDLDLLGDAVAEVRARLVVIDPLTAFLRGNVNSEPSMRQAVGAIAAWAERTGVAVLFVRHLTKGGSANPLYRGGGSIAIVAAARSALLVANDPAASDPHRHVLAQTKTNLSAAATLGYRTVKRRGVVAVEWLGPVAFLARDLAGGAEPSALEEALWVLYSILRDGPVPANEAISTAAIAGVAKRTLDRAKRALRVVTTKQGSGLGSRWTWELPDDEELLRPFREREREERLRQARREVACLLPGDPWQPPDHEIELYELALQERGFVVVRFAGQNRVLREEDAGRAALLDVLALASASGDVAAGAAYGDILAEMGG
jgi:hypothetical protein